MSHASANIPERFTAKSLTALERHHKRLRIIISLQLKYIEELDDAVVAWSDPYDPAKSKRTWEYEMALVRATLRALRAKREIAWRDLANSKRPLGCEELKSSYAIPAEGTTRDD